MKTKRIYLLRHGETDFNKTGRVQGRGVDSSLNATGKLQAERVFKKFGAKSFDTLYSSSLVRTKETLSPFGLPAIPMVGFDEISWGNQEGVEPTFEARKLYAETIGSWRKGQLDIGVGGGESPIKVMDRQRSAMQEVLSNDGNNILICMHGRAIRILLCWLLNYPLNYMDGFPHQNCSYYSLLHNGHSFSLDRFNETSHLDG
ncbi:MAG: histidine phosphatase family protein [Cyclobacteriaceae bacterium]